MKYTPLYNKHLELGAEMFTSAMGYAMPAYYSSVEEEARNVRNKVGMNDISLMGRLDVKGKDSLALTQKLIVNNAEGLSDGQSLYSVMCNDQGLVDRVIKAGETTGEKFWQLPMLEEHRDLIKSGIADMKNSGGRAAGSITGGYFIREFAGDTPWVHLDIAGTARTDKERGRIVKGHTGIPVRMLVDLVLGLAEGSE